MSFFLDTSRDKVAKFNTTEKMLTYSSNTSVKVNSTMNIKTLEYRYLGAVVAQSVGTWLGNQRVGSLSPARTTQYRVWTGGW